MAVPVALNLFFGPAFFIILIFIECAVKYSGNRNLKNIFLTFLIITFLSLIMDIFVSLYAGLTGGIVLQGFFIRAAIHYFPVFAAACIIIYLRKKYKQINPAIILLLNLYTFSLGVSVLAGSAKFIWPVIAALFLYAYLFIIMKESKIDLLTGLDNRYSFFEFTNSLSRNKTGNSWIIAMIDINNFKSINEIYGYLEGDNALRLLASAIKTSVKKSDFAARFGGDEFVVVTRDETDIDKLLNKIKNELDEFNKMNRKPYNIEICFGYEKYTADGSRPVDEFINRIDKLMRRHNEEHRRAEDNKTGRAT